MPHRDGKDAARREMKPVPRVPNESVFSNNNNTQCPHSRAQFVLRKRYPPVRSSSDDRFRNFRDSPLSIFNIPFRNKPLLPPGYPGLGRTVLRSHFVALRFLQVLLLLHHHHHEAAKGARSRSRHILIDTLCPLRARSSALSSFLGGWSYRK